MHIIPPKLSAFLDSMLEDNSGGYSTMRVLLVVYVANFLCAWQRANFTAAAGVIVEIPTNVLGTLTAFLTAKVIQRYGEQAAAPQVITPTNATPTS